jgi:hypothetical protein
MQKILDAESCSAPVSFHYLALNLAMVGVSDIPPSEHGGALRQCLKEVAVRLSQAAVEEQIDAAFEIASEAFEQAEGTRAQRTPEFFVLGGVIAHLAMHQPETAA